MRNSTLNIGEKYGRLTVASLEGRRHAKKLWRCNCECGGSTVTTTQKLRSGHTKSCGCYAREVSSKNGILNASHGHARSKNSRTYSTWKAMMTRCTNEKAKSYAKYGGRGINVCERWRVFDNFLADMGERPEGTTIDRINNHAGYSVENCRWATPAQQSRNQTTTKLTEEAAKEIKKMLGSQKEIAKKFGVSSSTIGYIKRGYTWK